MKPRKTSRRISAGVVLAVAVVLGASACGGSEPEAAENSTSVVTAPAQDAVKALEDVRSAVVRIEEQGTFDYPR
jgi:CHASE3 domain sensor protein